MHLLERHYPDLSIYLKFVRHFNNFYPMKYIFAFLFFALIFNKAVSQEKYLPGYVKTLEGDTILGLIDYRNWNNNPKLYSSNRRDRTG